jgi:membrane protein
MAQKISWLQKVRSRLQSLSDETAFRPEAELSRLYKFVHFWVLVGRSFMRNRCPLRASALSYTTLLALIPMLAVAISVTSSLLKTRGEQQIYQFIDKFVSSVMPPAEVVDTNAPAAMLVAPTNSLAGTNEMASATPEVPEGTNAAPAAASNQRVLVAQKEAARSIHEFVQNTRSGAIAGVGMLALVYMAIRMLTQIEDTFNEIWGVTRGRNWLLRIVLYWATITLGPMLLAAAVGLTSGSHLGAVQKLISHMPVFGGFIFKWLPVLVLWLAFALVYWLMPNTKVRFSAAFVGGAVSGSLWQLNNMFGFLYVSRVVTNSKIYGSLGLVPVFMAGVYLSWFILLFGAQVAYAFQNRRLYLQEKLAENVNQRGREFIALRLMTCVGQRFLRGMPPATIQEMSGELGIPSRLVQQVLQTLMTAHLVIEISGAEAAYTPARPLETVTAHHVLQAMRTTQGQELMTRDEPVREEVYGEFARIRDAEKRAASSLTMLALAHRAQARLELASPPPEDEDEDLKLKPALVPPQPFTPPPTEITKNPSPPEPAKEEDTNFPL